MVERARLEIECASKGYRGFESPPLRQLEARILIEFAGFFVSVYRGLGEVALCVAGASGIL